MRACGPPFDGGHCAQYIAECDWYATNFYLFHFHLLVSHTLALCKQLAQVALLWTHQSTVCLLLNVVDEAPTSNIKGRDWKGVEVSRTSD
jgi:hypothetical protein